MGTFFILSFILLLLFFFITRFSRFFLFIYRVCIIIVLIIIIFNVFGYLIIDYQTVFNNSKVYKYPNIFADYEIFNTKHIYFAKRYNSDFYEIVYFDNVLKKGYTYKNSIKGDMNIFRELFIKLILSIPIILLMFATLSFDTYYAEWKILRHTIMGLKERIYIDSSVLREIRELKRQLNEIRVRKSDFDLLKEKVDKLKQRAVSESTKEQIEILNNEIEQLQEKSNLTDFGKKLLQCNNFVEESLLRLDFEDYKIAVEVYKNGVQKFLIKKTGIDEDFRTLIKIAYKAKIIDYDFYLDLNWISNLRDDFVDEKGNMYIDELRLRRVFEKMGTVLEKCEFS